jgi:hypothetical protein
MQDDELSKSLEQELAKNNYQAISDPAIRRKKLALWFIRNALSVGIYWYFWDYVWVRWTLVLTVPMSLLSLLTITLMPFLLQRKVQRLRSAIEHLEDGADQTPDQ